MNKQTIVLGVAALILGAAVIIPQNVYAYRGDATVKGPNYTEERHETMAKAFQNNDYNAWKALMADRGRASEVINAQNFTRFAEAHKLLFAGKTEEAAKIRAELGLGVHYGSGMGGGRGQSVGCNR